MANKPRGTHRRRRGEDPRDPRFPRPRLARLIRVVLAWLWAAVIAPVFASICIKLVELLSGGQPVTSAAVLDAMYLTRLAALYRSSPAMAALVAAIVVAVFGLSLLARRDVRREKRILALRAKLDELQPFYTLTPVRDLDPENYIARYVESVYLPRRDVATGGNAEEEARETFMELLAHPASREGVLGILLTGRATLGKSRFAFEAIRDKLPNATLVRWPWESAPPFDFTLLPDGPVVLWLDNLHTYTDDVRAPAVNDLPNLFAGWHVIVVATSQDGRDEDPVRSKLGPLVNRLREIRLADITPSETTGLACELVAADKTVYPAEADGTPGSLLLGVREMLTVVYGSLTPGAKAVFLAMRLLRSAGIYDYPAARVRAVARERFGLGPESGAWSLAADELVGEHFAVRGRMASDGLYALEPSADVYFERPVSGFPVPGTQITDDWPLLQSVFERDRDTDALMSLGIAFLELPHGLDPARLHDILSARVHAEQCFRLALSASTPGTPDWASMQNNLGNALRDQAGLATGTEQQRLLGEAVAAYRAALSASTPGTPDWAGMQNNLGSALLAQAGLATGTEQQRLLGEAVAASRAALSASTPGTPDWAGMQYNLASTLVLEASLFADSGDTVQACADLREARDRLGAALPVMEYSCPAYFGDATGLHDDIQGELRELGCRA